MINLRKISEISLIVYSFFLFNCKVAAQQVSSDSFYFEFHTAIQNSFGPSENQAEIIGGYNPNSYDEKKHLITGFKECFVPEIVVGYRKKNMQLQSSMGYYKQDIGLIQNFEKVEYPFLLSNMLSVKITALYQLSNSERRGFYGLYAGIFIGTVIPTSYTLNEQTKAEFGIDDFHTAAQFNWGIDFKYNLKLGKKGFYVSGGTSLTFPGIIGSLGNIELLPSSSYTIVRDEIKMYSINIFCGLGFQLEKNSVKLNSN